MGSSSSKQQERREQRHKDFHSFRERIYNSVSDEVARRMMLQREVQMSVNIAKARDTLQIFGPLWLTLTTGIVTAVALKKPVPHVAGIPVVVGGLALTNMADMAYGNKLQRVSKEAERIMEHERYRFVAPKQVSRGVFNMLWKDTHHVQVSLESIFFFLFHTDCISHIGYLSCSGTLFQVLFRRRQGCALGRRHTGP